MSDKVQLNAKIDANVVRDFDEILNEFKETTGIKPVRQESIETALKDYIHKIKSQIEILKKNK